MRVNVYTEELINGGDQPLAEIVTAEYTSSRTGLPMKNYGLRVYLKSAPDLHYIPGRDDDRSAVTFWCGDSRDKLLSFWEAVKTAIEVDNQLKWRDKVADAATKAEAKLAGPTVKDDHGKDVPCPDYNGADYTCQRMDNFYCQGCPEAGKAEITRELRTKGI